MRYRNRLLGILVLAVLLIVSPLRAAASADGDGFASSEAETADGSSDSVWEENNDGDDTYISNDGTVFRIPRAEDSSKHVYDFSGTFTVEQEKTLEAELEKISSRIRGDAVLLVTDGVPTDASYSTETSMRYCRQFYIDNQFGEDGLIFLIDLNNRVLWLAGHGRFATDRYSKMGDRIRDDALKAARDGDYYQVARIAADRLDRIGNVPRALDPTGSSVLISAAAAVLAVLGFVLRHSRTQPSKANTPKVPVEHYRTLDHDETYLGTTVVRRRVHTDSSGGGGGEGFGGTSSGGFSDSGGNFSGGGGHF